MPLGLLLLLLILLPRLWGAPWDQHQNRLELQEIVVTVQEGVCELVPCKLSNFWVSMVWYREREGYKRHNLPVATSKLDQKLQDRNQGPFILLRDPQTYKYSLIIRDMKKGDSGTYFFLRSSYGYSYLEMKLSLRVTALTHTPFILTPEALESGCPWNLTCSVPWTCEMGTPPIFFWRLAPLRLQGFGMLLSSVLTFTPRPQDHGTQLTCQVQFPAVGVTVERTIQLNVSSLKTIQNASSLSILEGQALRLLCEADSNPPATLSWFRRSLPENDTVLSNSSTLELPSVRRSDEGEFICQAQNQLGSQLVSLSLSVNWRAESWLSGVQGAVTGAATTALLSLCLGLLFRLKNRSRKAVQPVQTGDPTNQAMGSASREQQCRFWKHPPARPPAPAGPGLVSSREQELHYALLRFPRAQAQPQGQEDSCMDTEYTEIKIST
ncbi:sialic acid-binding Ig-like lectin 6 isoform X2 [Erinaceus europaeus]|uniref:Sialic acid-binding Ig-like lectin 6 isoform X2 n=1 Tax=Erinaceus europaeus TaxID=9365 RepID=A0ABM3W3L7_ERIEU|nr:sialic acid-binding Ig-like lectin 6 isoform X2 [Erinaceus europaeus]